MDGLGVARASIAGCSFGGFLAVNQALETPDRVERIVLISPAGTFASQYWKLTYAMRIRAPMLRLMRRLTGKQRAPSLADLGPRRLPRDTKWAALIGATMAEKPKVSVTNATVFSRAQLRAIRAPTLLLIGDRRPLRFRRRGWPGRGCRARRARSRRTPTTSQPWQPDDVNARIVSSSAKLPEPRRAWQVEGMMQRLRLASPRPRLAIAGCPPSAPRPVAPARCWPRRLTPVGGIDPRDLLVIDFTVVAAW